MSGYVASARIVRASPRLARAIAPMDPGDWRPAVADQASIYLFIAATWTPIAVA